MDDESKNGENSIMDGTINLNTNISFNGLGLPNHKKIYHVWKGNNKFCCGGKMVFGPDAASLYLTALLIGVPAAVFFVKMILKMKEHNHAGYFTLSVGIILTILVFIFLFFTATKDPGIIPRNPRAPPEDEDKTSISTEWVNMMTPNVRLPRTKDITINGISLKVKFCETCFLYRPPRGSHCSVCNNCVQKFDHHCPWVGQCIGRRNYRNFFCFISLTTCVCIYIFTFSWINILGKEGSLGVIMSRDIISVILIVYCFIAVWFVGGLTVFHCYLICTNQTTYENFRYRYDKKENPFNKGVLNNIEEFVFSDVPPSLVNFQEWVADDDDDPMIRSTSPDEDASMAGPRKSVDIEVGSKRYSDSRRPFQNVLEKMDYTGPTEKLNTYDSIFSPIDQRMKRNKNGSSYDSIT